MEELDRRIGQRRDATRAPTQARSGWRPSGRLLDSPPHHLRNGEVCPNNGVHLSRLPVEMKIMIGYGATVECRVDIDASCEEVFDAIHDYRIRLRWDTLLSKACIVDGSTEAGLGVRTLCVGRNSL